MRYNFNTVNLLIQKQLHCHHCVASTVRLCKLVLFALFYYFRGKETYNLPNHEIA